MYADTAIGLTSNVIHSHNFFMITTGSSLIQVVKDMNTHVYICKKVAKNHSIIPQLAEKLQSKNFITLATAQDVKHKQSLGLYEKASTMMEPAIDHCNARNVDQFIKILEEFRIEIPPPQEVCFYSFKFSVFTNILSLS